MMRKSVAVLAGGLALVVVWLMMVRPPPQMRPWLGSNRPPGVHVRWNQQLTSTISLIARVWTTALQPGAILRTGTSSEPFAGAPTLGPLSLQRGMVNEGGRWVLKSRGELNSIAKGSKNPECAALSGPNAPECAG